MPYGFVPLSRSLPFWPSDLLGQPELLEEIGVRDFGVQEDVDVLRMSGTLLWFREIAFDLPLVSGFSVALLNENGHTAVPIEIDVRPDFAVRFPNLSMSFRFQTDLLKSVRQENGHWVPAHDPSGNPKPAELRFSGVGVGFDLRGNIEIIMPAGAPQISLGAVQIGETGIVLEIDGVIPYFSETQTPPAGAPPGFRGVAIETVRLHLPEDLAVPISPTELTFEHLIIGTGGFSGTIRGTWNPVYNEAAQDYSGNGSGTLFGIPFALRSLELTFQQNIPTASSFHGEIVLPFFDRPVGVEISLGASGALSINLSAVQPPGVTHHSGLVTLEKESLLRLMLDSIGFELQEGVFKVKLSGEITPLIGGLDWPTFTLRELSIDSKGHVHLDGGWLDLPAQYALDFHAFKLEITRLGFGRDEDGGKWIGFSGGLRLVEGLPAGASVEGLRVIWYEDGRPTRITLDGVGVEFEVPGVVRFQGAVSYRELTVGTETVHRFDGDISLDLLALDVSIDATLVIGSADGPQGKYTFFAIYLDVELPAGIPLASTGLGLYGFAGLFALSMEPDKHPDEPWYGVGDTDGWYHRGTVGVTDLRNKWVNRRDSLALGAGVTIGTLTDNGYIFSGKVLLVIVFPGPILLIEGKANLLKERAQLSEEALFRSLAVLDGRAGTFLIGIDVNYKYEDGGELIDLRGGVEAFFNFNDASAWHLYMGLRDPREKRIRAEIFQLFEANAYFMLDAHQLAMGAWVGYDKHWSFGPLSVTLGAWIEGNVVLSWKPTQLSGDLWLHGQCGLRVFGFGLNLSLDARFNAEVFNPFRVRAEFSVGIDLPWPLPDFDANVTLEWARSSGNPPLPNPPNSPPLPLPLKEIAIEHFKVTTSWPLPRGGSQPLLLPNYDSDGDGFLDSPNPSVAVQESRTAPPGTQIVPLDARPHITFGRSVHDVAMVGVNSQPVTPEYERIGDPTQNRGPVKVKYSLTEVALHKAAGTGWALVAQKPNPVGVRALFGSWAPMPALPDGGGVNTGQTKLWLWSKTPFDYTRHSGRAWDEWFSDRFSGYPCLPPLPDREICCDFENVAPSQQLSSPWSSPEQRGIIIDWQGVAKVVILSQPVMGRTHAVCFAATVIAPPIVNIKTSQPAKSVRLLLAEEKGVERRCVDFRQFTPGSGSNPVVEQGANFLVADHLGKPVSTTEVRIVDTEVGRLAGLDCFFGIQVLLPCSASSVELTLSHSSSPPTVELFNAENRSIGITQLQTPQHTIETVTLNAVGIKRIVVACGQGETTLHQFCFVCPPEGRPGARAVGFDAAGNRYGPFPQVGSLIEVTGDKIIKLEITGRGGFCLVEICLAVGADPAAVDQRDKMMQHARDELARWSQVGDVLEPHTTYRLKVVTKIQTADASLGDFDQVEFAYFRTEGPPGLTSLSVPIGTSAESQNGLNDLARYVRQTIPATVPDVGEKPPLPRPVYRGYDVGAEFNENYVDLMYRMDRRDLGLYLYDNNNRPVRDASGKLIVLNNLWGKSDDLTITASDQRWINTLNGSNCHLSLDTTIIPHDPILGSAAEGQVLISDTVYEARLVPLLLHEAFSTYAPGLAVNGPAGSLDGWSVFDEGNNAGPSHWEIREEGIPPGRFIVQTANIWSGTTDSADPVKPGTLLLRSDNPALPPGDSSQPGNWTDYRLSLFLRSEDANALGIVFRYLDSNNYYRFSMDRHRKYRRLVRVVDETTTILAEDDFVYQRNHDYLISVEVIGASLRIYQDGALVFDATDNSIPRGRFGLYSWSNSGTRFSDIRVDDFRAIAPVVYRFKFTTSEFVNFFHHLHSFQDEIWRVTLPTALDITAEVAQAVTLPTPLTEAEARAYESFATKAIGQAARLNPVAVQVSRIEKDHEALALLLQSPEPIDWQRTSLEISRASQHDSPNRIPHDLKLTDVAFGSVEPNEESVTVLLRESVDLSRVRIDYRHFPGPAMSAAGNALLLDDDFTGNGGLLFAEAFGPNALDHYVIVDEGTNHGPSTWTVVGNTITQTSDIYGGSMLPEAPDKPGTIAVTGSPDWANVRVRAIVRSDDDDSVGIVFRYQDANNYYRFSMDSERSFRRLIKKVGGVATTIWEDSIAFSVGRSYQLEIESSGNRLLAYLDNVLLFSVSDQNFAAGRVGLYCWANHGAIFEALSVEEIGNPIVVWQPELADLSELEIKDQAGASDGPSLWAAMSGLLTQSSNIHVSESTDHKLGTYALGGKSDWVDVQINVSLRSDVGGALGVMFRFTDEANYYRFSMDSTLGYRRLIKKVGGMVTTLWQDSAGYGLGQSHAFSLRAVGSEFRGYLDGVLLFIISDRELQQGRVAFYSWANADARFEHVVVTDQTRRAGRWAIRDEGTTNSPSVWRMAGGALLQKSAIAGGTSPAAPGTLAITGESDWRDYLLSVQLRSDTDQAIGIVFRYVDDANYYRLSISAHNHYRRLIKKINGTVTTLWEDVAGYPVGSSLGLTVKAIGPRLLGFFDRTRLFEVTDHSLTSGKIGLYCEANDGARFEQVIVEQPALEDWVLFRDRFHQNDVSGWSFVDEGTSSGPANWIPLQGELRQTSDIHTPPTDRGTLGKQAAHAVAGDSLWTDVIFKATVQSLDDDAIGLMFRYMDVNNYYRFSMDRQRWCRRLVKNVGGAFTLLWEDFERYDLGRTYELTVALEGSTLRGYIDGVPLFVVEDTSLPSGRIGLYCWQDSDARFSNVRVYPPQVFNDWILDEHFSGPTTDRWLPVDDGDLDGPSHWSVSVGELHQTSNIYGGTAARNVPDKPGTYVLAGDANWTNYRVSVTLSSDEADAIGVMFRYQDGDNYYRFSMGSQRGYRRLVKKVGGVFTVLWEDARRYLLRRSYTITLDCVGQQLTGYLNGSRLFSLDESSFAAGKIGLYCWANRGARFKEVRVSSPVWSPYYTFKREELLPAGTRVRIHPGNVNAAPSSESGLRTRFAASFDQEGERRFLLQEADLRLANNREEQNHRRLFLSEGEYDPIAMQVLRKADGTGLVLMIPDASRRDSVLPSGEYRLRLRYLRNNKASDPTSQIFSEAGNSSSEDVVLDVPWHPS